MAVSECKIKWYIIMTTFVIYLKYVVSWSDTLQGDYKYPVALIGIHKKTTKFIYKEYLKKEDPLLNTLKTL